MEFLTRKSAEESVQRRRINKNLVKYPLLRTYKNPRDAFFNASAATANVPNEIAGSPPRIRKTLARMKNPKTTVANRY